MQSIDPTLVFIKQFLVSPPQSSFLCNVTENDTEYGTGLTIFRHGGIALQITRAIGAFLFTVFQLPGLWSLYLSVVVYSFRAMQIPAPLAIGGPWMPVTYVHLAKFAHPSDDFQRLDELLFYTLVFGFSSGFLSNLVSFTLFRFRLRQYLTLAFEVLPATDLWRIEPVGVTFPCLKLIVPTQIFYDKVFGR